MTDVIDMKGVFESVKNCFIPSDCEPFLFEYLGITLAATICQQSVANMRTIFFGAGCSHPFIPPSANDETLLSELCPASCASVSPGFSEQPTAPIPPTQPPMPPSTPGPSGFLTITTVAQLRAEIDAAPPHSSLKLYLPPGSVFLLCGTPLIVGPINLQLVSEGKGATLDAEHRSRVIAVHSGSQILMRSLVLARGYSNEYGGAILVGPGISLELMRCRFVNSTASKEGGAMSIIGGRVTVADGSSIVGSKADSGGALTITEGLVTINKSSLVDSNAKVYGGAIRIHGGSLLVADASSIVSSTAKHGGAIDMAIGKGRLTVASGSSIVDSTAQYGGAIRIIQGSLNVNGCVIANNRATMRGGAIYAIYGRVLLTNGTTFRNNTAPVGNTLYIETASVIYTLPVPVGHFISATQCDVMWVPCPADTPCWGSCGSQNITLEPRGDDEEDDCGQRPPYHYQVWCPWDTRLSANAFGPGILNQILETLSPGPLDFLQWPIPCPAGIRGATANRPEGQMSSLCDGLCDAGFYCPTPATFEPIECPIGNFCPEGSASPQHCPAGRYSRATRLSSALECLPCPLGSACPTGSTAPTPCAAGSAAAALGASQCTPCSGGSFQSSQNATGCVRCDPGSVCPPGVSAPQPCKSGSFGNVTHLSDQSQCLACLPGMWCSVGAVAAEPCNSGSFSPSAGQERCSLCGEGRFSSTVGSTACSVCPNGTYSESRGQGQCIPCPYQLSSPAGAAECSVCAESFYLVKEAAPGALRAAPSELCLPCPEHTECPWNTSIETIVLFPGHWRLSNRSREITKCDGSAAEERCKGGAHPGLDGEGYCSDHHTGPECLNCRGDRLYLHEGECHECPGTAGRLAILLSLAVATAATSICCFGAFYHPIGGRLPAIRGVRRLIAWLTTYARCCAIQAKAKIIFSFYGIITVLNSTYDAKLPSSYTDWVHSAFSWARPEEWLSSLSLPPECIRFTSTGSSFRSWLLLKALTPLLGIALAMIGSTVVECARRGWSQRNLVAGGLASIPVALVTSFILVPSVSNSIFQSWLCVDYLFDGRDQTSVTRQAYLSGDLQVRCSGGGNRNVEHSTITTIAAAFVAIWPVGMVVLYLLVLLPCRTSLRARSHTPLVRATSFLHQDYHVDFFFWELIELNRRTALIGWVLLIPTEQTFLRLVVALLLSISSLALLLAVRPYRRAEDNGVNPTIEPHSNLLSNKLRIPPRTVLAACCQLTLVFGFIGAMLTRLHEDFREQGVHAAVVQRVMIFTSTAVIATPLIALTLAMAVVMLIIMVAIIHHEGHLPTIHLEETGAPPELTIQRDKRWHLFLSHIWSTGQE